MTLGVVDTYLPAPERVRDEGFHQAISELLDEWAYSGGGQDSPAVHIVAHTRNARAHELRDIFARNGVPYAFHSADSETATSLLDETGLADATTRPVVITYAGATLVDPGTEEIAGVFGLAALPVRQVDVAVVDQPARCFRGGRRPRRLHQTRRRGGRRRSGRRDPGHPVPHGPGSRSDLSRGRGEVSR